jgi:hypothetical protein
MSKVRYESDAGSKEMLIGLLNGANPDGVLEGEAIYYSNNAIRGYGPAEIFFLFGGDTNKVNVHNGPLQNHPVPELAHNVYIEVENKVYNDAINIMLNNASTPSVNSNGRSTLTSNQVESLKALTDDFPSSVAVATNILDSIESVININRGIKESVYHFLDPKFTEKLNDVLTTMEGKINKFNYKLDLFNVRMKEQYISKVTDRDYVNEIKYVNQCHIETAKDPIFRNPNLQDLTYDDHKETNVIQYTSSDEHFISGWHNLYYCEDFI